MFRSVSTAALILLFTVPASGMKSQLYPFPSDTLTAAGARIKALDHTSALKLAVTAPSSGIRDFIAGTAAFKSQKWEDAARYLASAVTGFELLADYALLWQGESLRNLGRLDEALAALQSLLKLYPESPLRRQALLAVADTLYAQANHKAALAGYLKFIETYPTGNDALNAQLKAALCRDALGDQVSAVKQLRTLWVTNPNSPVSAKADEELKRLVSAGAKLPSFTADELFRRASTLLDLKKYPQAVNAFREIPRDSQGREFLARLDMKTGQSLYRARRYREAEQHFSRLTGTDAPQATVAEATYWLARVMDKTDRKEEAVALFSRVVERWPKAEQSDDALLESAYIRKSQKRWADVRSLLKRILSDYPETPLKSQAWWDAGWSAWQAGDWRDAADYFKKLADADSGRDRALYWLARALASGGDSSGAETAYSMMLREYPLSFYSIAAWQTESGSSFAPPKISGNIIDSLPLPSNHERIRALIACGLLNEARQELRQNKLRGADQAKFSGIARLFLEMDDFNGAFALAKKEPVSLKEKEKRIMLALQYPFAFRETVSRQAAKNTLPEALVNAVIRAESSFSPSAISPAGAVGLMQLLPSTAAQVAGKANGAIGIDMLTQPETNITYGVRHLKDLLREQNGDLIAVIASYNAGSSAVSRWRRDFGTLPLIEFIEQIPYGETREYVKHVIASTAIYAHLYSLPLEGISLPLPAKP